MAIEKDGLQKKYQVRRTDGRVDPAADYFVLRLDRGNPHAMIALEAYSRSCEAVKPKLAQELRDKIRRYRRGASVDLSEPANQTVAISERIVAKAERVVAEVARVVVVDPPGRAKGAAGSPSKFDGWGES